MTIVPEKRTVGYLVYDNFQQTHLSRTSEVSNFVVFHYDWQEEVIGESESATIEDVLDEHVLSSLYAESAEEDEELSNMGMEDYSSQLKAEDNVD